METDPNYVPGTENIFDLRAGETKLKRDQSGLILIPQPSDSINDPLNWSRPRKYWHFALLMVVTGLTAATSNDAGAAQLSMNEELGISWTAMNTAAGVLFVGIGCFTVIMAPTAFLYGRKITYLVCIVLGLAGSVWFARVQGTSDSVWNQLFVGASEACAEAQVQLSITDIFFQHQLGTTIGTYILATSIGTFTGPIFAGLIADNIGWRWVAWIAVFVSAGVLVVFVFLFEETYFDRASVSECYLTSPDEPASDKHSVQQQPPKKDDDPQNELKQLATEESVVSVCSLTPQGSSTTTTETKTPYWKRIAPITFSSNLKGTGFKQYCHRFWLTLRVFLFPPVLYSGLQWGAQDAWLTFYMTTQDENWSEAPWNYGDTGVAVMNIPTLIGALIGCIYGGALSDRFAIWMAKRNGGVKEPEHRLWFMFLIAVCSPLGMFLFGIGTGHEWAWPAPYIGLGLIGVGWGCAGDLSMSYVMESYPALSLEVMAGVSFINNMIGCIFTFSCQAFLDALGTTNSYVVIGVLDLVFIMTTVPMMIYGKRCRKFTKGLYLRFVQARDGI